ncbi:MAG: hypothetical protein ACYC6L_01870 [Anaerolineae bacterium]
MAAKRLVFLLSLLALTLAAAACRTAPAAPTGTPPANTPAAREITLADNGGTIRMAVNETTLLRLGEGYTWVVTIGDESVFRLAPESKAEPGVQGVYLARQTGQTTLTAVGTPACRSADPPCSTPEITFEVTVKILLAGETL